MPESTQQTLEQQIIPKRGTGLAFCPVKAQVSFQHAVCSASSCVRCGFKLCAQWHKATINQHANMHANTYKSLQLLIFALQARVCVNRAESSSRQCRPLMPQKGALQSDFVQTHRYDQQTAWLVDECFERRSHAMAHDAAASKCVTRRPCSTSQIARACGTCHHDPL